MSVGYAELDGIKNAMNHYAVFSDSMKVEMKNAITELALRIVNNAKGWIKRNKSIGQGTLRQSGSVRPQLDGTVDAGFSEAYAYFVEYGRRAGGFPPIDTITEWVRTKKRQGEFADVDDDNIEWVALQIARKIAARGTQPHPFLMPAVAQEKKKSNKFWRKAYQRAVNAIDK